MPADTRLTLPKVAARPLAPAGPGILTCHPRYRAWLHRCGVRTVADALTLGGEIVGGHPDRHVALVTLRGRRLFLKREHAVGWRVRLRNWRAGFGRASRSAREGRTLAALEAAGMPAPQWLAYGESPSGEAVLLIDEVPNAAELRDYLRLCGDRNILAERLGRALAELHEAGFSAPELAAKHVLISERSGAPTLLDWQSAPRPGPVPAGDRLRQLAGLDATLPGAEPAWRARLLWSYRRSLRHMRSECEIARMPFADCARRIGGFAGRRRHKSSARDQHAAGPARRLVWLAGEAVCVVPELVPHWPRPATGAPFYIDGSSESGVEILTLANGWRCRLERRSGFAPLGVLRANLRGRPWRSPSLRDARLLTHLARHGVAAPELVAFGQRLGRGGAWAGFTLTRMNSFRAGSVSDGLGRTEEPSLTLPARNEGDRAVAWLRRLHAAGAVLAGSGPYVAAGPGGEPRLASASAATLRRDPSPARRRADLRRLLRSLGVSP